MQSSRLKKGKPPFFLDLDETIICSVDSSEYDPKDPKQKAKADKLHSVDMDDYYKVFKRPGLDRFLDYLFDNFTVSVWTAATRDYAAFIVDKIILTKPSRALDWIFFSYHCDISEDTKGPTKDLDMLTDEFGLPKAYKSAVILDDNEGVQKAQPGRCINAKPFDFADEGVERDTFLIQLIPKLALVKSAMLAGSKSPAQPAN